MYEETDVEGAQLEPLQHPQPMCIPRGEGVPRLLHRQWYFHQVVANKGIHSIQVAWNMHFLFHTWVRQRIQSSQQPPE